MKPIVAILMLSAVLGPAHAAEAYPAAEQALIGAWHQRGNAGFFEEFSLQVEAGRRVLDSWLHQRPDITGASWKLVDCRLIVESPDDGVGTLRFRVLGLKHDTLRLYDESDRLESIYVRVPEQP
ncbi:hypothetical protein ATSB10_00210 [Dyella thiooxydans]|uniref:Uncharacterized protein n=1 Tax=Dyella thiooxydans TaxID=445710 RepID=A0A169GN32_9GAMM|nr:hypothetical protein [Dyella thiooxydans]AND67475.1 hypothetical protein ATSB10_00210 [Dyella thiooxydans]